MENLSHLTYLMEFHADKERLLKPDELIIPVKELLGKHFGEASEVYRRSNSDTTAIIVDCNQKVLATLHLKPSGLILLNLEISPEDSSLLDIEGASKLENELKELLVLNVSKSLHPIRRGGPLDRFRYLASSDDRLLEYDVDHVVADVKSPFQHIQIFHTMNYGNLLVLDGLQNLAESDIAYTEGLIRRGKIDYSGKDVLILGAGDGALLHELLKENPRMVTMIEIDEMVMNLCSQHLRTACGSALDARTGPNHQIIVGDCLVELDKFKEQNTRFDFVFSDLTDIPLSAVPQNKEWQFLTTVLEKSLGLLKETGTFLTHGSGASSVKSLSNFEGHLRTINPPVDFERYSSFVPSFMENWVFYQVRKVTQ
nr:EOG090X07PL [Moina brachiata]